MKKGLGGLSPAPTPEQGPSDSEQAEDRQAHPVSDPHSYLLTSHTTGKTPKLLLTFQILGDHRSHSALMGTMMPEN